MGQQQSSKKPLKRSTSFSVAKSKLSRIELVSLKYTFRELKTSLSDQFECIEAKQFLEHLDLPTELETAGVLLYKAFSYLGDYPNLKEAVPLSLESFVTSFVVLIGRYDEEPDNIISDELFFQALSILPDQTKTNLQQQEVQVQVQEQQQQQPEEVSLEDLDFNAYLDQLDSNKYKQEQQKHGQEGEGESVLNHDLIHILFLLLWLGTKGNTAMDQLKQTATKMVSSMSSSSSSSNNNNNSAVTWDEFREWKKTFAPHLFKPLQSFILKSFGYYHTGDKQERLLLEDGVPVPDKTDILNPLYSTLITWALPEKYTQVKTWQRLYSSDEDGFSMNRFETHVFKYPGPTIILFQIDVQTNTNARKVMVVGAFITEPWKQSRHSFWGSNQCFLFELDPTLEIYRSTGKNDHYIYYHHDFGIGFGGKTSHSIKDEHFILKIENTLQQGIYSNELYPSLPTFQAGGASGGFDNIFDIIVIEVFGLGTERDKQKQEKEWLFDQKEAQRRAGLNIRQADGALDKELLKMAGIIDMDNRQDR